MAKMTSMEMPSYPQDHDAAIVMTPSEMIALRDAITCFGMVVEGGAAAREALALYADEDTGIGVASVEHAYKVHEKVDRAQAPHRRKVRAWIDAMKRWDGSHT